jgi:hypothetical protein
MAATGYRCKIGFASEAMSQTMIVTPGPVGLPQLEWTVLMTVMIIPALVAPKLVRAHKNSAVAPHGHWQTQTALSARRKVTAARDAGG